MRFADVFKFIAKAKLLSLFVIYTERDVYTPRGYNYRISVSQEFSPLATFSCSHVKNCGNGLFWIKFYFFENIFGQEVCPTIPCYWRCSFPFSKVRHILKSFTESWYYLLAVWLYYYNFTDSKRTNDFSQCCGTRPCSSLPNDTKSIWVQNKKRHFWSY